MTSVVPEGFDECTAPRLHGIVEILGMMRRHFVVISAMHQCQWQRHQVARHVQARTALVFVGILLRRATALSGDLLLPPAQRLAIPGIQISDASVTHDGGKTGRILGAGGDGHHASHGPPHQVDAVEVHTEVGVHVG